MPARDCWIVNLEGRVWLTRLRSDSNMPDSLRGHQPVQALETGQSLEKCMSAAPDDKSLAAPGPRNSGAGQRHDWRLAEVEALFDLPFMDLMFRAQQVHRAFHAPNRVQMSTLLSIKTGGCPEDCGYCPQSIHFETGVAREEMLSLEAVVDAARKAQAAGATRFCMGAAFRSPKKKDIERIAGMIREVGALGLETCATLGMLTPEQAHELKDAGLDYYNHNVDSSEDYYKKIISTRTYQHRLDTLEAVRNADLKVCSGGIVGMGETRTDRAGMLVTLANLPQHPQSVPINQLVQVKGTPLAERSWRTRHQPAQTGALASMDSSSCAPLRWRAS